MVLLAMPNLQRSRLTTVHQDPGVTREPLNSMRVDEIGPAPELAAELAGTIVKAVTQPLSLWLDKSHLDRCHELAHFVVLAPRHQAAVRRISDGARTRVPRLARGVRCSQSARRHSGAFSRTSRTGVVCVVPKCNSAGASSWVRL